MDSILQRWQADRQSGETKLAVLLDPDKYTPEGLQHIVSLAAAETRVAYWLVGGSLLSADLLDTLLAHLRDISDLPVVLFPGSSYQINTRADALMFLSLISGRNPDLLIGQHVLAAPMLRKSALETIPVGYVLIDGGRATSVQYISNTQPIPADKPDIAVATALAGQMLGLQAIYLEAGSGAQNPVSPRLVAAVKAQIDVPLIVGGGIRSAEAAKAAAQAGADILVIGTAFEHKPELLSEIAAAL